MSAAAGGGGAHQHLHHKPVGQTNVSPSLFPIPECDERRYAANRESLGYDRIRVRDTGAFHNLIEVPIGDPERPSEPRRRGTFPALREIANPRRLDAIQLATELALGDDGSGTLVNH
jgi:hypothetical protein